ncbi:hypothetical protein [Shewanella sp. FJAT-52076]|uniref:hypothetical protein n=1 Tax=Shewanella sp. FJAT-52076 TaxID=2864202 RepID=UPI001C6596FA|nr:hypothetical protein [Shewanella sp. FJAT-52076]QYJ74135.1 hypothetical protein K0H79_12205 [Shewanella sp. FJAT-52076]
MIKIQEFIKQLAEKSLPLSEEDFSRLERVCHRIDACRSLHVCYNDEFRPVGQELIDEASVWHLCTYLMLNFELSGEWKYLNTAGKLLNGHLSKPIVTPPPLLKQKFAQILSLRTGGFQ